VKGPFLTLLPPTNSIKGSCWSVIFHFASSSVAPERASMPRRVVAVLALTLLFSLLPDGPTSGQQRQVADAQIQAALSRAVNGLRGPGRRERGG